MEEFLTGVSLTKSYQDGTRNVEALKNVTIGIRKGEAVALMGPSGSGKSTLLQTLGLLITPTSGKVSLEGEVLDGTSGHRARWRNENFGYIHQDYAIIEKDTVFSNIAIPLDYARPKVGRKEKTRRVTETALSAGIDWPLKSKPSNLSGGERQRVAIARALTNNPKVVLADEPTGALDAETANQVLDVLLAIRERNASILISTHDPNVAAKCDRTLHIVNGELAASGDIIATGISQPGEKNATGV